MELSSSGGGGVSSRSTDAAAFSCQPGQLKFEIAAKLDCVSSDMQLHNAARVDMGLLLHCRAQQMGLELRRASGILPRKQTLRTLPCMKVTNFGSQRC